MKPSKKSLANLKHNKSRWNNSKTIAIRVPEILAEKVLSYARKLDEQSAITNESKSTVHMDEIKEIVLKIKSKQKGYKSNSASQLIKDLIYLFE